MIKVALFEDNKYLRNGLFQLIDGTSGFSCVGAFSNCDKLVEKLNQSNPHVVLMDIEMPGLNGIEGVALIKEYFPSVKVLMDTIFDDEDKIFNAICAGADGYILKNTSPAGILEAIREIYEGGSAMTPSVANKVLKILKDKESRKVPTNFDLTLREKEILTCLVEGLSYKMTADTCAVSIDTVNAHVKNIYKKLQVHSKSEAVAKAIKNNLI
ncbi:response regulator transcription factor [Danxiaibacter flavus]|uniref:Response regulator transcription factor n=1 Tax=Danxiaibacter flavus TaxID=3049108 RepID=A0ABV3ZJ70_9BACT|nr:response regulator transcription factor [Chitinophagaceae bacterium DXS]